MNVNEAFLRQDQASACSAHLQQTRDLSCVQALRSMFSASLLLATSVVQRFSTPRAATSGAVARRVHGIRAGIDSFEVELFSPAKVSLFLRILGRRDDGFHEMASLCQTVDLGDRLRLARIPAGSTIVRPSRVNEPIKQHAEFSVSSPGSQLPAGFPLDQSNMVVRALVNAARSETRATVTYSFGRARCEKPL